MILSMNYLATIFSLLSFLYSSTAIYAQKKEVKAYVYLFLAEECPICQYYSLPLRKLAEKYEGEGVAFQGIFPFPDASQEGIAAFKKKYKLPFPVKVDQHQALSRLYEVSITPEVIMTDAKGEILYRGRIDNAFERPGKRRRVVTEHDLSYAIQAVLKGEKPPIAQTQAVGCFITFSHK